MEFSAYCSGFVFWSKDLTPELIVIFDKLGMKFDRIYFADFDNSADTEWYSCTSDQQGHLLIYDKLLEIGFKHIRMSNFTQYKSNLWSNCRPIERRTKC